MSARRGPDRRPGKAGDARGRRLSLRTGGSSLLLVACAAALTGGGCGRRGPPLPPVVVTPEAPTLFPLRLEGGEVTIRWSAPLRADDGTGEEISLRRAVVLYRLLDLPRLAAEQRAARRNAAAEAAVADEAEALRESEGSGEDPEPPGFLLDTEAVEFEVLSELESRTPGEERRLELPVNPAWVGRRLEVRVRYESRGGPSEDSELQALDITEPVPPVEAVEILVGESALTLRWTDSRPGLTPAPALADPIYEVLRRRGDESATAGRALGTALSDPDIRWGDEVCYRVRLLLAGADAERVLPDPGAPAEPEARGDRGSPPEPEAGGGAAPSDPEAPDDPVPDADAPLPSDPPPPAWSPLAVRIPPTGARALSLGPLSPETCIIPMDTFPPPAPTDLRVFWRAARTDLSWSAPDARDLAGYHVYRSGADGSGPERLTKSPIGITAFTDSERPADASHQYQVTAVDGADPPNESPLSDPALAAPRR